MNVDVVSEAGSVSSSGIPSCSSHFTHQHHSPYATISSVTSPSSSNAPLVYTVNNSSSSSSSQVPLTHQPSQQQQQRQQQQNTSSQVSSCNHRPPAPTNYSASSLIHSAVASALSVPLAGSGRLPYPLLYPAASSQAPPSAAASSGASGVPDNSSSQLIQDILVRSVLRQMSHQETGAQAINWKRLHLSKGKLKASSRTSALLSGFAMVAMVEVQLCENQNNPIPFSLLIAFAICTTLLVSVHMLALMISTCILPNVEAVASMQGLIPIIESPHEKLSHYVEIAWVFSTVFGILLFMIEVILLCWVKFWEVGRSDGRVIALIATILLLPIMAVFIGFAVHFYRNIVAHQYERSAKGLEELQVMVSQLQSDRMAGEETDEVTTHAPSNVASHSAFESSSRFGAGEASAGSASATVSSVPSSQATSLTLNAAPTHVPGDQMSLLSSDPLSSLFHDPSVIHT